MVKKVLIVNGSARINGNTDILIKNICEGAKKSDVSIKIIELRNKTIKNCIGCYQCLTKSKCSIHDDMDNIRDDINESELLIFASPLYWWSITGLMKILIDRLYFYYHKQNKGLISGKKVITITPMYESNITQVSNLLTDFYNRLFDRLKIEIVDIVYFEGIMEKGAISEKHAHIKQAFLIGERLINL